MRKFYVKFVDRFLAYTHCGEYLLDPDLCTFNFHLRTKLIIDENITDF